MDEKNNKETELAGRVESALLEAEQHTKSDTTRLEHHTVFSNLRKSIDTKSSKERER